MSSSGGSTPSDVFLDTCVVLNYLHVEWEVDRSTEFLESHPSDKVISERVEDELDAACERRSEIYPDMLDFIDENEELIQEYRLEEREIDHSPNDFTHVESIQMELAQEGDLAAMKWRLRRYVRRFGKKIEYVKTELLEQGILEEHVNLGLEFGLSTVIEKAPDCHVVCDAVGWKLDGGSGFLATLDGQDLLDDCDRINAKIREYHPNGDLKIEKPADIP